MTFKGPLQPKPFYPLFCDSVIQVYIQTGVSSQNIQLQNHGSSQQTLKFSRLNFLGFCFFPLAVLDAGKSYVEFIGVQKMKAAAGAQQLCVSLDIWKHLFKLREK